MSTEEFEFVPPPEAPVFEPTAEEFKDPLGYIAKIRPIAEKTGICKIKPPSDWQPPFAVDVDNFRFTPRMQRLNELEATTRIKLNFLDQIAKFWELQGSSVKTYLRGSSLKIPNVERKALDLFTLYRVVHDEGGMDVVSRERKWARIATRMGYPAGRGVGSLLRQHYERILYPYDVFQSGATLGDLNISNDSDDSEKRDRDYIPHGIPSRQAIKPPDRYARRSKRHGQDEENLDGIDYSTNSELRKLQFYGAGPKMPGYLAKNKCDEDDLDEYGYYSKDDDIEEIKIGPDTKESLMMSAEAEKLGALLKRKERPKGKRPIEQIVCSICNRGDSEAFMLLCDGCDDSYHTFCLIPPLAEIPKGDWRCPRCVAEEVCKPQEAFGFEQAQREYTLQEFGEKADQFKTDYFNMPVHRVPYALVEKEFWRIVNAVDEDVTVEYGADLHTIDHGSGFPNKKTKSLLPGDEEYVHSGWNLNNLPVLEGSVLKHINADISGMKIPWTYVGMCFATFCWHNEDHWSYSINYLHWGEPKTWYGVPGGKAECFEDAMRSVAPELFESQPDLLHQLVTIMNPNLLISLGVPIFRTNQRAGEFVVTFPRSYHAGFNQGYNFAEAVNFAPADWLPIGRVCVSHYRMLHRFCVFSHDELVCKMATDPDRLDVSIAASTYQDMLRMVETEKDLRKSLLEWGVNEAERENFELLPDDERQCEYCKTTCFLSAVTCGCDKNQLVCVAHKDRLCSACTPDKHVLRYRYTLDELPTMLLRLKVRAESFDVWAIKVKAALEVKESSKYDIADFKELIVEAEEKRFPKIELMQQVEAAVVEGEKCSLLAQQILSQKVRTRNRQSGESKHPARLTLGDLQMFNHQLSTLVCDIKESLLIKDLLDRVIKFQEDSSEVLEEEEVDSKKLEKLLDVSLSLDVDLPEIPQLKQKLVQRRWLEEVKISFDEPELVTLDILRKLLDKGVNLPPHYSVEKSMAELQDLLTVGEKWEEKSKVCLQARPKQPLSAFEAILQETGNIPVHLPNVLLLKDAAKKAKDWSVRLEIIQNGAHNPYLDVVEFLVIKGRPIPVHLEQLPHLENQVETSRQWRDKTGRTFLKKNSSYSLLEALSPRKDIGCLPSSRSKKKKAKDAEEPSHEEVPVNDVNFEEAKDPATIVAAFKHAERQEVEAMQQLRAKNLRKRLEESPEARYCVCNKPLTPSMLQCELCKDWFHVSCIPLPKSASIKKQQQSGMSSSAVAQLAKDVKFLCPMCLRSRRPRLETILSLLLALQKLPVRLPEGEALQCLTERGMSWQDRARQALATEELAAALAKLSVISQRMSEQAAREKTEKIINTELMKAASNPELKPHLQNVAQTAFGGAHAKSGEGASTFEESNKWSSSHTIFPPTDAVSPSLPSTTLDENVLSVAAVQEVPSNDLATPMDVETSQPTGESEVFIPKDESATENPEISANYSLEHAYSSASKNSTTTPVVPVTPRKHHPRKSPLTTRQMEPPVLQLSDVAIAQLEQLMMEGDLLEMSLEETQHIWSILQATKLTKDSLTSVSPFSDFEDSEISVKGKTERKKKKKKPDDGKGTLSKVAKSKRKLSINGKDGSKHKKKKIKLGIISNGEDSDSGKSKKMKNKDSKREGVKKDIKEMNSLTKSMKLKMLDKTPQKKIKKTAGKTKLDKKGLKSSTSEIELDDKCSAGRCLRPTGEAVHWVQCDGGCELWFHLLCVGLDVTEVSENEDYICATCSHSHGAREGYSSLEARAAEFSDNEASNEKAASPEAFGADGTSKNFTSSSLLAHRGGERLVPGSVASTSGNYSSSRLSNSSVSTPSVCDSNSMDTDLGLVIDESSVKGGPVHQVQETGFL